MAFAAVRSNLTAMDAFPAFFPLAGATVVIAGEGHFAEAKARLLAPSPARIVRLTGPAAADPAAYAGAALAFVASEDAAFRAAAAAAAKAAAVPVNVVDEPALCDFHTPAVVDRGAVVVAVGTSGTSPILAAILRTEIESRISPGVGLLARLLGERREAIRAAFPDLPRRRAFLRRVIAGPIAAAAGADPFRAAALFEVALAATGDEPGLVSLVVAGSAPDLLSLRAVRALAGADVLVAAEGSPVAELARRDVERLAGADAAELAALAADGRRVAVILSGPDPALAEALAQAGAPVEIHAPAPAP